MKKKLFLRKETVALLDGEQGVILGGFDERPYITNTCKATVCSPCETMYMRSCAVISDFTCPESAQQCIVMTLKIDCQAASDYCVKTELCVATADC